MSRIALEELAPLHKEQLNTVWSSKLATFLASSPLKTYPPKPPLIPTDPFTSPIQHLVHAAAYALVELLFASDNPAQQEHLNALEECLRLIALQSKKPEETLALFFGMKDDIPKDLEAHFDTILITIISMYMRCRENIYTLRMEETVRSQKGILRLLEKKYL